MICHSNLVFDSIFYKQSFKGLLQKWDCSSPMIIQGVPNLEKMFFKNSVTSFASGEGCYLDPLRYRLLQLVRLTVIGWHKGSHEIYAPRIKMLHFYNYLQWHLLSSRNVSSSWASTPLHHKWDCIFKQWWPIDQIEVFHLNFMSSIMSYVVWWMTVIKDVWYLFFSNTSPNCLITALLTQIVVIPIVMTNANQKFLLLWWNI